MEKKRINLFKKVDTYVQLDEKLRRVNYYGIAVSTIFLVIFLGLFSLNYYLNSQVGQLSKLKQSISQQLSESDTQFKVNYVFNKTTQLQQYDKNDAHFTTYYTLLKNMLGDNNMPSLSSFQIDNKQMATFSFQLNSYEELQKIIQFTESKQFSDLFTKLTIKNAAYDASSGSSVIQLEFNGVLQHVNERV